MSIQRRQVKQPRRAGDAGLDPREPFDNGEEGIQVGVADGDVGEAVVLGTALQHSAHGVHAADGRVRELAQVVAGESGAGGDGVLGDLGAALDGDEVVGRIELEAIGHVAQRSSRRLRRDCDVPELPRTVEMAGNDGDALRPGSGRWASWRRRIRQS